jgi:hypothetical protein
MLIINHFIDCSEESKECVCRGVTLLHHRASAETDTFPVDSAFVCAVTNPKKAVQVPM